ncbi:MAG: TraE/TraK family type IV conjugative transfer system protein [Trichlorobacter sp.]|nr:TraE/TraK family type IV conjugative transfer system protein [Trichlorobacter sp.]
MLTKIYQNKLSNLLVDNLLLKFVVIVIGISQIFLGSRINYALQNQRTILVPPNLDTRVQLTGDYASRDYVKSFARTIVNLAFTYSYPTVRAQYGELLQFFSPEGFVNSKDALNSAVDTIETTRTSSVFIINKQVVVDTKERTMTIEGSQRMWTDTAFIESPQLRKYIIGYSIENGKFQIEYIKEGVINATGSETEEAFLNENIKVTN